MSGTQTYSWMVKEEKNCDAPVHHINILEKYYIICTDQSNIFYDYNERKLQKT